LYRSVPNDGGATPNRAFGFEAHFDAIPKAHPFQLNGGHVKKLLHSAAMTDLRQVMLYTRKGCHLCEIVKESLLKLHRRGGFQWSEVDVDSDEKLRREFNDQVPVVFIDGHKAFKYRMDEREFLRKLAS